MAYIKARTLLNHCFALDEFVPGLCTSLVGSPLIERELALNSALPQASFLRDHRLLTLFNEALKGRKQPLENFTDAQLKEPASQRNPLTISVIYYLYSASVLIPWFFNKGIFVPSHARLQQIFADSRSEADLLHACYPLPQWSIFVSLPFFADLTKAEQEQWPEILRDFGGFYASVMLDENNEPELGVIMVESSGLPLERFKLKLSAATFKDSAAAYLAETHAHYNVFVKEQPENFDEAKFAELEHSMYTLMPYIIKICAHIAKATDFVNLKGATVTPGNIDPKQGTGGLTHSAHLNEQFFCLN